ncbi:tpr protein [Fusarium austroafricanum]|uniref:Tpr protein n=1 Tax=Fusarium austroafricanum TaxID=2364996 RepID=A0A8H4KHK0_9HYPO|nr:tpr protein [Fusarium austroafricanum]
MATYTEQLAYNQTTEAGVVELLSSPPTPRATYEDLPETPRATFTDQMPYLQSPVPAYMELRASPPTPKATDTEQLADSQPTESVCIESGWPFSEAHVPNEQWFSQVTDNDVCADASPISYLSDECNHCGCSDFDDDRAPRLEDIEFRRSERSLSKFGDLENDVSFNSFQPITPRNLGSPFRPQQIPKVPGTPKLSGSPYRAVHDGTHSTAIAMTFQGLEALSRTKSSQVQRNNMQISSRKRKFETRLSNKDDARSKKTKKNKRTTSRASFQLMALHLKDADSPPGQTKEWTYEWNSKFKAWVADRAPEGYQLMSGEELYFFSQDLTIQVRPNSDWLPVYMKRHGDVEFRASDSLESDCQFTIADEVMQSMLIWNMTGEGTVTGRLDCWGI